MGLPVRSFHDPSVATSSDSHVDEPEIVDLQTLMMKKDKLEKELKALGQVLDSVSIAILSTTLVIERR